MILFINENIQYSLRRALPEKSAYCFPTFEIPIHDLCIKVVSPYSFPDFRFLRLVDDISFIFYKNNINK